MLKKKSRGNRSNNLTYAFKAKLWKSRGPNGWHFLTLPIGLSTKIRKAHLSSEEGWGRLKVACIISKTKWPTAIWFDTKMGAYLLPIKAEIRKKERLEIDAVVMCSLEIEDSKW